MSGSTIGGIVGGVIGFYVGGPTGAKWGWMIGSVIGGEVDPDVIKGPRLDDRKAQTSAEGIPRPLIYGLSPWLQGNVIMSENIAQEHHRDTRTGKGGGPVQREYYYTRTVAIRICRAAPLGGEMMLRRARVNGKLAYDATGSGQIDADSAKFFDGMRFYSGSETQMPDSALEALPASDGGGVGNVNAYRGSCYIVFPNLECPNGALPQFEFEVASAGTQTTGYVPGTARFIATNGAGKFQTSPDGLDWTTNATYTTAGVTGGELMYGAGTLLIASNVIGASRYSTDKGVTVSTVTDGGSHGIVPSRKHCEYIDGRFFGCFANGVCSSPTSAVFTDLPANNSASYVAVGGRKDCVVACGNTGYVIVYNADYTSYTQYNIGDMAAVGSNGARVCCVSTSGTAFYTDGSGFSSGVATGLSSCVAITGVGNTWVAVGNAQVAYSTDNCVSWTVITLEAGADLTDITTDGNTFVVVGQSTIMGELSLFFTAAVASPAAWTKRSSNFGAEGVPSVCYIPCDDGFQMPDAPGWRVHRDGSMCTTGATIHNVDPDTIDLSAIVGDLTMRAGITDYDVSALSGIAVTGYPILQPTSASAAIGVLQQVYFIDYSEWGNSGDLYPKLRAVLRGGASALTLTDDDLVDTGDDDLTDSADGMGTRRQSVEFPMKLNFIAPDYTNNYETIKQTASRESENVKAASEVTITTPVLFNRDESAQRADILLRIAWDEAAGQIVRTVPEAFTVYTNSDIVTYGARRYRIDKIDAQDGQSKWTMTRDRASSLVSNATGSTGITPPATPSALRGPTILQVLNAPRLRSSDVGPGVYVGVCGLLPGWNGCDLYLSVDGGTTEQRVATIIDPATMGWLTADMATGDVTLAVQLYNDDELDDATDAQLALRMNAVAVTTAGVSEILQFKESTDTGTKTYDLTTLTRNLLGTTDATHAADSDFMLLDGSQIFVPLDVSLAGKTLIWRPVTRGTTPSANATYSMVFQPQFYGVQVVENYTDDGGEAYTDDSGNPYYKVIS